MKTQVKQPEAVSHTIQGKNRASKQASVESVLQKMESKTVESVELKMESENPLSTLNSQFSTNETGIPDTMKANFENFSGFSFDDVRVHYNSPKPAQLQALAYTQGNQVHIAPGQEKHLGHELGHVVQQKQGRVQPTMQLQGV
ncbi:MAG: DUF4157 domain-containing protein, partial [Prevotellaceae bacterium]|nr:DUF4157 domain-containing protein [Prevotellaceae bacterium]